MNKRILIVEESLRDLKAHWFSYIKTISDGFTEKSYNVDVATNVNVAHEIRQTLNVHSIFDYSIYLDNGIKRYPGERYYSFILHSARTLKALWPFFKRQSVYDFVFVPTVLVQHLLAWWLIMSFHPRRPKEVMLFFVTNPGVWDNKSMNSFFPKRAYLQKILLKLFRKLVLAGRVRLGVETKKAQQEFELLTGLNFELLPHPVKLERSREKSYGSYYACFGFARHEKGTDLLKAAIEKLLIDDIHFQNKFLIQWTDTFRMPDGTDCGPGELLISSDKVIVINSALNEVEYNKLLQDTSCMILPYRNSSYYARVSRVAIEAVCLGIPIIYTKNSWLEELVVEYGTGIGIDDENVEQLVNALFEMVEKFSFYKEHALNKAEKARTYFSPEFFTKLLKAQI